LLIALELLDKLNSVIAVQFVDDLNQRVGTELIDQVFANRLVEMNEHLGIEFIAEKIFQTRPVLRGQSLEQIGHIRRMQRFRQLPQAGAVLASDSRQGLTNEFVRETVEAFQINVVRFDVSVTQPGHFSCSRWVSPFGSGQRPCASTTA